MCQTNQSIPGNRYSVTDCHLHLDQRVTTTLLYCSGVCKCCVHQCGWCRQPKFDAWANSGQPEGVWNQWNGMVEWTSGMEYWNGLGQDLCACTKSSVV